MAKITWNDLASRQLEAHLDYALEEFGQKCVRNWYHYFDAENDTVYIDAIWDMRMNPIKLKKMIE